MCILRFVLMRGLAAQMLGLFLMGGLLVPTADAQASSGAAVELSPTPPNLGQGWAAPNIVVTFDNARSIFNTYSPESRPFDSGDWNGPWRCAGVIDPRVTDPADIRSHTMNSVYYNPNMRYLPPVKADGTSFREPPQARLVPLDGISIYRPRDPRNLDAEPKYHGNPPSAELGRPVHREGAVNLMGEKTVIRIPPKPIRTETRYDWQLCSRDGHGNLNATCACSGEKKKGDKYGWDFYRKDFPTDTAFADYCFSTLLARVYFWWDEIIYDEGHEETRDDRWTCGVDKSSPLDSRGGPYYYRYKRSAPAIEVDAKGGPTGTGLRHLYDRNNWEEVRVGDAQNFVNWYAYYRTPDMTMRTTMMRAFGRLGGRMTEAGYGNAFRVAWQNIDIANQDPFVLQDDAIISALIDVNSPVCNASQVNGEAIGVQKGKVRTPPNCYRTAFFNWLSSDTHGAGVSVRLSDAIARAHKFFLRGNGNTGATGDLHDPYWEPPVTPGGDGLRLTCRQNFHMVVTDKSATADGASSGNVRTAYFNPGNPQNLIDQISKALTDISADTAPAAVGAVKISAVNTSVLTPGALGFNTGYNPTDWSGTFQAVALTASGAVSKVAWDAGAILDDAGKTSPSARNILSSSRDSDGSFKGGVAFKTFSDLDSAGQKLLSGMPVSINATSDTGQTRLDYLRGDRSKETATFRKRSHLLGAIVGSQAVYVGYPSSGYRDSWPTGSPEQKAMAGDAADCARRTPSTCRSYEAFVKNNLKRKPAVYVGANDGMLHAFDASMGADATPAASAGKELFAYVPRAVYAKLGYLTLKNGFKFMPTVDGVPVTRDVYFSQGTTKPVATSPGWRTILVGGLRLGGRGVYALDITDPGSMGASKVLWEFSADTPKQAGWSDGRAVNPGGDPANLGYTYGQPNIGRLNNGKWVVLVPGGYFPDCGKASFTGCTTPAAASNTFSSLFVLDAQTGKLIRELKTSDASTGATSHGLATPVLGDYNDDQVDDVAFAGDLDGNLWRYDFSSSDPAAWKVTLAFKPVTAGTQPITGMPRLFPDPATSKLIAVFGTGKYLGPQDGSDVTTQSVYGIRDIGSTVTRSQLVAQTLREATADDGKITARGLTDHAVPSNKHGWYFDLGPSASSIGERVIVTPTALFDSGRVVIQTLIPGSDPCSGGVGGALMVVNAATGGSGGGLSSLSVSAWTGSGTAAVGGRVDNPRTASGTMPVVSAVGGGSLLVTGLKLSGSDSVLSIDDAIWRRRSWRRITP